MSTERDELAKAIYDGLHHENSDVYADAIGGDLDDVIVDGRVDLLAVADMILAAGYRRPRTVTASEELDALPVGSVVRDEAGDVAVRAWADKNGWRCWSEIDYMDHCADALDAGWFLLPATVLHEGAQS